MLYAVGLLLLPGGRDLGVLLAYLLDLLLELLDAFVGLAQLVLFLLVEFGEFVVLLRQEVVVRDERVELVQVLLQVRAFALKFTTIGTFHCYSSSSSDFTSCDYSSLSPSYVWWLCSLLVCICTGIRILGSPSRTIRKGR